MKTQDNLAKIWRAVIEFDMIKQDDKILVGFSGGKDSMFLTAQLAELKKHSPFSFDLACLTVNTNFAKNFPEKDYKNFCEQYNLPWYFETVDVPNLMQEGNTACYSCAYFRRAAINRRAVELGFNKVALAHHHDDAVETFFMNILTSGQLKTFKPVTKLSRSGITVIRPLVYYREEEIKEKISEMQLNPIKNFCPYDGNTMRQKIKEQIKNLSSEYAEIYEHLGAAMRQQKGMELWPEKLCKDEVIKKFREFWQK